MPCEELAEALGPESWGEAVTSTQSRAFDPSELERRGPLLRAEFEHAAPFPHVVIDGLFHEEALDAVVDEFPDPRAPDWDSRGRPGPTAHKNGLRSDLKLGTATRALTNDLNSGTFLDFVEEVSGITGLVPDPHLHGAGLHQIERDGYLKVHADFSRHPRLRLERRINLIVYLNRDWRDEYGGELELWDRKMTHAVVRTAPKFNRCVIFATTRTSYHGHPEPLNVPEDLTRKSVAMYYYSNGRPEQARTGRPHGTLFQRRPDEEAFLPDVGFTQRVANTTRRRLRTAKAMLRR